MNLSKRTWFWTFQGFCYVMFALSVLLSLQDINSVNWALVAFASIAATYFDIRSLKLPSGEDLSMVASVLFVIGVTNGVLPILIVTVVMTVCMTIYHRETLGIILFNACQYGIAATLGTLCYQALDGTVGGTFHFSHMFPYLMFNVTYFACNVVCVGMYLQLKHGTPIRQLLVNMLEPQSVLIYFVTLCFGIFMTIIYQSQGLSGLIASSLLLAVLAYTFRRYYELFDHFRSLSNRDELTGLNNHRYFQEKLNELISQHVSTALLLIDLDHFKSFNDVYGHLRGDELLRDLAKLIESSVSCENWTCRYGGEEFGIILPHTTTEQAAQIAENIRKTTSEHPFEGTEYMPNQSITVSIGVASYPTMATNKQELIQFADEALYTVKYTTRNRVEVYSSGHTKRLAGRRLDESRSTVSSM